jgi:creatinine amidohydrolase/Fe(II)-dependent formamide hydrolase-like protein
MTWPEILDSIAAGVDAVILPVGATEQHGPHLGTGMDFVLADKLSAELGKRTKVPVLPTLPYGASSGHSHRWPGTLALQPTTLIAVLCDLGDWLYRTSLNGVTGAPSQATRESGTALFEQLASTLAGLIRKGLSEQAPLEASYFHRINKSNTL